MHFSCTLGSVATQDGPSRVIIASRRCNWVVGITGNIYSNHSGPFGLITTEIVILKYCGWGSLGTRVWYFLFLADQDFYKFPWFPSALSMGSWSGGSKSPLAVVTAVCSTLLVQISIIFLKTNWLERRPWSPFGCGCASGRHQRLIRP